MFKNALLKKLIEFLFSGASDFETSNTDSRNRTTTLNYCTEKNQYANRHFTYFTSDGLLPTLIEKITKLEEEVEILKSESNDCIHPRVTKIEKKIFEWQKMADEEAKK